MKTLLTTLILMLAVPTAQAQIYRWVDENGKVHYGDKIPPQYAKQERQKLNEQGVTVQTEQREQTLEERAQAAAERAEREAAAAREAEQNRYDNFLLSTYPSVSALDRARADRLAIMDGQISNARKSQLQSQDNLKLLQDQAARITANDRPVPARIQEQIKSLQEGISEAERRIAAVEAERETIAAQFDADRARLETLRPTQSAQRPDGAGSTPAN